MKTGECGCRHVNEVDLLHEISDELGWTWQGEDNFDVWAFMEGVDKVLVSKTGVEIVAAGRADYDEQAKATA